MLYCFCKIASFIAGVRCQKNNVKFLNIHSFLCNLPMNGKLSFDAWRCIVKESEIAKRRSITFKLFKLSSLNALHNKKVEYNIYVFPLFISLRQMSNFSFDHNNNIRFRPPHNTPFRLVLTMCLIWAFKICIRFLVPINSWHTFLFPVCFLAF